MLRLFAPALPWTGDGLSLRGLKQSFKGLERVGQLDLFVLNLQLELSF